MPTGDDHAEIRNLANRYFDAAWRQDVDAYVATFVEDGEIVFHGMNVPVGGSGAAGDTPASLTGSPGAVLRFKGSLKIREMVATSLPRANPLPFGHNHLIDLIDADSARGTIMVTLYNGVDFQLNTVAYYRDLYARTPKGWLLRQRAIHTMMPGARPQGRWS